MVIINIKSPNFNCFADENASKPEVRAAEEINCPKMRRDLVCQLGDIERSLAG